MLFQIQHAYPHDNYQYIYSQDGTNCCNGKDCLPFDGIEVKPVDGGYFVPKFNVTVPMAKTGYSPDHRWHICMENHGEHGGKKLRCLLVPAGGA